MCLFILLIPAILSGCTSNGSAVEENNAKGNRGMATDYPALTLDEKIGQADSIVYGKVEKVGERTSEFSLDGSSQGIFENYTLSVYENYKGQRSMGSLIPFRYQVGEEGNVIGEKKELDLDSYENTDKLSLKVGEYVLLFLKEESGEGYYTNEKLAMELPQGITSVYKKDGDTFVNYSQKEERILQKDLEQIMP